MPVATETARAVLAWTGTETSFSLGFAALDAAHVAVTYTAADGAVSVLTPGTHVAITRDAVTGIVQAAPLALPAAPGTLTFDRRTPATQAVNFADLVSYSADTHTRLHDASALRDAELRRDLADVEIAAGDPVAASVRVFASSDVTVEVSDDVVVINRSDAAAVTVTLPAVATAGSSAKYIFRWDGNGGDITLSPQAGDTIMGLSSWTVGSLAVTGGGGSVVLIPVSDLDGWLVR